MKRLTTLLCVLLCTLTSTYAQLTGIKTIPGDYATVALAVTDLNTQGVGSGGVTFNIAAGYTETISGTIVLTATGTSANPIIFQKFGAGANPVITAHVGTSTPGSATPDGIWALVGSDYVTIDGINLTDPNGANPATMEYGYGLFKASVTNGAQYNTIKNCTVTMNRANFASGSSPMVEGSVGILIINSVNNAATTALTPTSAAGTNSYNKIYSNTINSGNYGIVISGYSASSPFTLGDSFNDIGGSSSSTGNTVLNFGGGTGSTNPSAGIRTSNQWDINISYNNIDNNNGSGVNHPSTLRGIYAQSGTSANITITNNTLSIKGGGTSSQVTCIDNGTGSTAASNTVNINNNIIQNCSYSTGTTGNFYVINNSATPAIANINNNIIQNISYTGAITSGPLYCVANSATAVVSINGNKIKDITLGGTSSPSYCISVGSPTGAGCTVSGNKISNIARTGASGTQRGIVMASPANIIYDADTIEGISFTAATSTGSIDGIFGTSSSVNVTISNCIIRNLSTPTTGTIQGIRENGVSGTKLYQNNRIYNFYTTAGGAGGATFYGIYVTPGNIEISGNQIYQLNSTGTSGGTSGTIYGIYLTGGTTNTIFKNQIYNLSSTSTNPSIAGIYIGGGTTNSVYNNFISDLRATASTAATSLTGLYISSGTTNNIFYNTIYLSATGGTTFGSSGIYKSSSTNADLRNNIVVNVSTPGSTSGYTVAYRWSGVYNATYYAATSNNNCFYAGTPAANKLIFYDGTNSDQTLAAYLTRVSPRDNVSISENPPFENISTTPYDLHIKTTIATLCESGGVRVTSPLAIPADYDGDIRWGESGYSGTGTLPDIGADEFNGTGIYTCVLPAPGNTISTPATACSGSAIVLTLQNPPSTSGNTYQWQSSSDGITYSNISGATSSTLSTLISAPTYFRCNVTCINGPVSTISNPVYVNWTNTITSTTPAGRCGTGTVTLQASGSAGSTLRWYSAITGGSPLSTGTSFTTPSISTTTNYYVGAESTSPYVATIGSGASTGTSYAYNPFNGGYGGDKTQLLFTAAELQATGLVAGYISSVGLNVTVIGTTYNSFTIEIGNTALSNFTSTPNIIGGLTTVYTAASVAPTVGINTYTLSTPFFWDGTSNIIISFCWSNVNTSNTAATIKYDATSNYSSQSIRRDNETAANLLAFTGTSGTGSLTSSQARPQTYIDNNQICSSPRSVVTATVSAPPALTITANQTVCNNSVAMITVTSVLSDYDSYVWTPAANLYTDASCTTPYVGGSSANTVYTKTNIAGTVTYTCTANNSVSLCSNIANSAVTNLPATPAITATPSNICISGTSALTVNPSTGYGAATFQWQNSPDGITYSDISGANTLNYTTPSISSTTYYQLIIKDGGSNVCSSIPTTVTVFTAAITGTTPASKCGYGSVTLGATAQAGNTIHWYSALTGGSLLGSGSTYTTPVISSTTNYYVSAETPSLGSKTLGSGASSGSSTSYDPFYHTDGGAKMQYLVTASELSNSGVRSGNITALSLNVTVLGTTYNNFSIQMGTSALSEFPSPVSILGGLTTVYSVASVTPVLGNNTYTLSTPFNWDGTSNIIISISWSNANTGGTSASVAYDATSNYASQSYTIDNETAANILAFTGPSTGTGSFNRSLNRPQIIFSGTVSCESARTLVAATIVPAPAINVSATPAAICLGNSTSLNVTSTNDPNYTYVWNPGNLSGALQTLSPAASTTYTVSATDASGGANDGCVNSATISVVVNPVPGAVTITPAHDTLCLNEIKLLTATGASSSGNYTFGTGASTSAGSSTSSTLGPNPLQNYYGGTKQQMLYTASELTAAGIPAGASITTLNINLASANTSYSLDSLKIKMANTATASFATTSSWVTSGLTQVYFNAAYTPSTGINTFSLSTPFVWDGTSNIVLQLSYSKANSGGSPYNTALYSNTSFTSTLFYRVDGTKASTIENYTSAASYSYSARNDVTFSYSAITPITWTPTAGLYTDASASTPYAGTNLRNVYAKPSSSNIYTATATNPYSCTSTATTNIHLNNLSVATVTPANISCNGANDGSLTIGITGGIGTVLYSIDNGITWSNSGTFSGLSSGDYNILVKDDAPCSASYSANPVHISDPSAITISNVATTNNTCNGGTSGNITITAAGGTGALQYSIDNGGTWQAGNAFNGLIAGSYTVKVKDANNCTLPYASNPVVLTDPAAVAITNISQTDVSCFGGSDASLTITATGGTGTLHYSIDNGGTWSTSNVFSGLAASLANVKVKDDNNCEVTYALNPVAVSQPGKITFASVTPTNLLCNGISTGQISIVATDGTGTLQYSIDNGATWSTSGTFSSLPAGSYNITVKDANACQEFWASNPLILTQPTAINISSVVKTDVTSCSLSDGTITITATDGTGALEYSIDNGSTWQSSGSYTGLAAGNYNVKVKDANSCIATYASNPVMIVTPAAVVIDNVTSTNLTCHNSANGTITITASAGTPPYTYSINGGTNYFANGGTFTGLTAGTYNIAVKDDIGCITAYASNPVTLTQPDAISISFSSTNVSCNGGSNGSATAIVTGGTGAYTYAWSPSGGTAPTASSLTAGVYTVNILDENSCTASNSITISQPSAVSISAVSHTNVSCFGGSNGNLTITASGGTGALQYSINGGGSWQAGNIFNGLIAGNYNIQVKDANNCTVVYASNPVAVTEPASAIAISNVATNNVTCFGASTGSITITAAGGTGTLQYSINNGTSWQSGNIFNGLAANTYTVIVNDANDCPATYASNPVTILQPASAVTISNVVSTNINCNGANNGSITITATGGTGSLQYSIDNGSSYHASNSFSSLANGNYNIKVEDANLCVATYASNPVVISQPSAINISNVAVTNELCFGASTGSIVVTATGGTGSLQYSIDNGTNFQASNTFSSLAANTYNVVVKDANNCQIAYASNPVSLTQPASAVSITSVTPTDAVCNGSNTGSIVIAAGGGTGSLQYSINNGTSWQAGNTFSTVVAGNYDIVVKDANNCQTVYASNPVAIAQPSAIVISSVVKTKPVCNGNADATLTITATGGTGALQYSIDNGATWSASNAFTGLIAGSYNVKVKDANACIATYVSNPVVITQPAAVAISSVTPVNVLCYGNNTGSITISANGGATALLYSIDNGTSFQTSNVFSGLVAGNYNVVIKDSNNCSLNYASNPVVINQPAAAVTITNVTSSNVNCNGGNDGSIVITANGGTGALQYSINNGTNWQTTAAFTSLISGSYTVLVKDANGCQTAWTSNPIVISQPATLAISSVTSTNVLCNGGSDGTITITATGGTAAYQYSIDNGTNYQASNIFTGLSSASYTIKIKDAHNCTAVYTSNPVVITEPASAVSISSVTSTDLTCNNGANGSVTITATGGTGALEYSADNGVTWSTSATINGLAAGNHNIRVRDANLCTAIYSGNPVVLNEPSPILITGTNTTNILCHGGTDGAIDVYGVGGTGALQYSIDSGATWQPSWAFTGLTAGNYNVMVQDANNCVQAYSSNPVVVTEPAAISITSINITHNLCNGGNDAALEILVAGGTGAMEYSINNGLSWTSANTFTDLSAGSFTVLVRDENYCTVAYPGNPVVIADPAAITITSIDSTDVTTYGGSDGSITVHANGGTGILQYSNNGGATWQISNVFSGLTAGGYVIQVKDENACSTSYVHNPVVISQPSGIEESSATKVDFKVYPDPTQGEFTIEALNLSELVKIEIATIEGKVVDVISAETFKLNNMKMKYEFASDVKGMYFIRLLTNDKVYIRKIVVN